MNRTYLKILASVLTVGVITIASVNRVINPFDLFDTPQIERINALKPEFRKYQRMMKAFKIKYHNHNSLILGSSRAEYGLNPTHPGWGEGAFVYNSSLSSANIYELLRYLELAQKVQPLDKVVIGIDFFMFNAYRNTRPGFDEERLHPKPNGKFISYSMGDVMPALFSLDALYSSIETVRLQNNPPVLYTSDGRKLPSDLQSEVQEYGYRPLFKETDKQYIHAEWFQKPIWKYDFEEPVGRRQPFEEFRKIIQICKANKTKLYILISPSHARLWSTLRAVGLWELFEEWKTRIVEIVEEEAGAEGVQVSIPIWDFSGYNRITTEEVPLSGDRETKMRWYWDSSHYTEEVGNIILDKVFGYQESLRSIPQGFGVKLQKGNLPSHLLQIREDQRKWEKTHPYELEEISKIVRDAPHISSPYL